MHKTAPLGCTTGLRTTRVHDRTVHHSSALQDGTPLECTTGLVSNVENTNKKSIYINFQCELQINKVINYRYKILGEIHCTVTCTPTESLHCKLDLHRITALHAVPPQNYCTTESLHCKLYLYRITERENHCTANCTSTELLQERITAL